jgi:gliding motility-associated-like protein
VKVLPAPIANAGDDAGICPGQSLNLNGSGGFAYSSWSPSAYLSNISSANPVFSGAAAGSYVYSLQVKDTNGCFSLTAATVRISVIAPVVNAGADTAVLSNEPVQLKVKDPGNDGFVQFNWSPSIGLNNAGIPDPVATTDRDRVYTVTAQTRNGCTATDSIIIKVFNSVEIYVPNAFTPNGDGKNDLLRAIPSGIKKFKFLNVYNRWGQLVFQTKDAAGSWDGKWKGMLQTGVFVWMAEGINYDGTPVRRKGTVMVIQ